MNMPTTPPVRKAIRIARCCAGCSWPATDAAGDRRDPDVGPDREPHAEVAGGRREDRADQEERRAAEPLRPVVRRQQHEQEEHADGEDPEGAELPGQVGVRALLDGLGDPPHRGCPRLVGEHLTHHHDRDGQGGESHQSDDQYDQLIPAGEHGCPRRSAGQPVPGMRMYECVC